jgi:hypothetical protein
MEQTAKGRDTDARALRNITTAGGGVKLEKKRMSNGNVWQIRKLSHWRHVDAKDSPDQPIIVKPITISTVLNRPTLQDFLIFVSPIWPKTFPLI